MPLSNNPMPFAGGHLSRAGTRRKDPEFELALRAHPGLRVIPVSGGRNLFSAGPHNQARAAILFGSRALSALLLAHETILLGLDGDAPVMCADLDESAAARVVQPGAGLEFADLRRHSALLPANEAFLLAYARGMAHWHATHRHCGVCGACSLTLQCGHARRCEAPACGRETYPRTDPAVIMLVEKPEQGGEPARCLLGRQATWPPGVFSTLAGFVEPGETLEEAVIREVSEEAGVAVTDVVYQGSQPWPFPGSIMLGFTARALDTGIHRHDEELADAGWFSAKELLAFGEWGDSSAGLRLPRRDSIARLLVEDWLTAQLVRE